MSENPYAPPSSRVEDAALSQEAAARPKEIVLVIQLAVGNYLLGLVMFVLYWDYFSSQQSPRAFILNQSLTLVLMLWIYYKIYVGRNWARIVLLILSGIGMVASASAAFREVLAAMPTVLKVEIGVGAVINLAILWLLFVSPGRHWFDQLRRRGV